jgi:hypothetical protein
MLHCSCCYLSKAFVAKKKRERLGLCKSIEQNGYKDVRDIENNGYLDARLKKKKEKKDKEKE